LLSDGHRVVVSGDRDRDMPAGWIRDYHLKEVAVPDDQVVEATAVDVPALASQEKQSGVDQEFFKPVGLARRGFGQARAFLQIKVLAVGDCDVPDVVTEGEDPGGDLSCLHVVSLMRSPPRGGECKHRPGGTRGSVEARPPGRGIGTMLIKTAEQLAVENGCLLTGLAVSPRNLDARRLYQRLGYVEWPGGLVVDRWDERDDTGRLLRSHADHCLYLVKRLERTA
jgi:GNAT superfamily N-acetyltransferase